MNSTISQLDFDSESKMKERMKNANKYDLCNDTIKEINTIVKSGELGLHRDQVKGKFLFVGSNSDKMNQAKEYIIDLLEARNNSLVFNFADIDNMDGKRKLVGTYDSKGELEIMLSEKGYRLLIFDDVDKCLTALGTGAVMSPICGDKIIFLNGVKVFVGNTYFVYTILQDLNTHDKDDLTYEIKKRRYSFMLSKSISPEFIAHHNLIVIQ